MLLASLSMFGPLSMDLYLPSLPHLARTLGTSDSLAQASMSACMIGLGAGQLLTGPLSDRFGRRIPVLCGVGSFAVLSAACAFAPTIEVLLVLRLLQGIAGSAGIVGAMAIVRDSAQGAELTRVLSLLTLLGALAPIIAPVIGGQLALVMDWRGIFGVLAAIGLVVFVAAAIMLRETLPRERRHGGGLAESARHFAILSRDRLFVALLLVSACVGTMFFSYLSMSSFVLQEQYAASPQLFSLLFAGNALATMAGAQVTRSIVVRVGTPRLFAGSVTGMALASTALLAAALAGSPLWPIALALAAVLFFEGIELPTASALALSGHGARAGTAGAALGTAGLVVGPIVAPLVSIGGASALVMGMTMAISAAIACVLVWALVIPRARLVSPGGDVRA